MVETTGQTVGAMDAAGLAIVRGQRRVDAAASRIAQVPAVPRPDPVARSQGRRFDATSQAVPRGDRPSLIEDTVELSRGSFEVKAGAKVARIQDEINESINRLGGRMDLYL